MPRTNMVRNPAYLALLFLLLTRPGESRTFKLGLLIPYDRQYEFSARTSASAVSIAIDDVNADSVLNANGQIQLSVEMRNTECTSKQALGNAIDLWYNQSVDAFIGPPCSIACRSVAEIASTYNIPVISWLATDPDLNDRAMYSTLSRTLGPFSKMGNFLLQVIQQYQWRRVVIISSNYLLYQDAARAIAGVFSENNITIPYKSDYDRFPRRRYIYTTLTKAKLEGRIIILISPKEDRRRFMLTALDLGMCEGEFVFYTVDILPDEQVLAESQVWRGADGRDLDAKRAFEAVFHLSLAALTGSEVNAFRQEVARRNRQHPWNFTLSQTELGDKFSPFLYDAVKLYAMAVSKTLRSGQDYENSTAVIQNMRGVSFRGYSGSLVLDERGDREPDYWIKDMDPETGSFVKIAEIINTGLGEKTFRKAIRPPSWPNGILGHKNAPSDTPPCGFRGELCEEESVVATWVVTVTVVAVCVITFAVAIVAVIMYRRNKYEQSLMIQSWRINYSDIEMINRQGGSRKDLLSSSSIAPSHSSDNDSTSSTTGGGSTSFSQNLSTTNKSLRSFVSQATSQQQIFTDIGHYRGVMIAVKNINKQHIQLTRKVLTEFCDVKEIAHENLNLFVGASIDPPNICVFWQYCHKGSLVDLLNNDDIKLDDSFKFSFMSDIVKGMDYLHKSHLKSHGNLKTSNCLVDARWTVRITDYGLPTVVAGQESSGADEVNAYLKKLWTAPELLRENFPPPCGTQKGDMYSFGIICCEIISRSDSYTFDNMTPRDAVNRVRNGESTPFRPVLPDEVSMGKPLLDLIRRAWSEDPQRRPTFSQARNSLRKMAGGEINILDNIMKMMESYANNLEEIVNARTEELNMEQKKTDQLLYKMLPSTAVEQLKLGRVVTPETYTSSTIYFSDIVGFTNIASDSSPMEIVDFLNDLYTCFDDIIAKNDVYKVETIGDAYMVVSGVPVTNGQRHVAEIGNCALELLSAVTSFRIRHRPHQQLQLRIGLHSGPVVAGVVGLIMPRYCLFGDTVNMAGQMEASGKPLRIHISRSTYLGLRDVAEGGYMMAPRGEMNIRGKGLVTTYWLYNKRGFTKPLPAFESETVTKEELQGTDTK